MLHSALHLDLVETTHIQFGLDMLDRDYVAWKEARHTVAQQHGQQSCFTRLVCREKQLHTILGYLQGAALNFRVRLR
jgi:hypothetical protein